MSDDTKKKGMFHEFLHSEVSGSIVLMICAVAALVWANSPWSASYFELSKSYISISWGEHLFELSFQHWINDGLMVIFFFVIGLEVKRELLIGELSSFRKAVLPVSAAVGGMVAPAALYAVFNAGGDGASGWGIPMATDIAFALGILALFGARAPIGLKIFLTALAIADDLGAIVVIALFYTESISFTALGVAATFLVAIHLAVRFRVRAIWVYALLMIGVWAGVLASGIHATIAGILIAMLIPVRGGICPSEFFPRARRRLDELEGAGISPDSLVTEKRQFGALNDLYLAVDTLRPPGIALEHVLHPVQAFVILPLFALFNAGVALDAEVVSSAVNPVSLGVVIGLVLGKPIGVLLFSWLAVKSGRAELPEGVRWMHLVGVGCLAGVGFTMSIFIAELAFTDPLMVRWAKTAILVASLGAGVIGYFVLRRSLSGSSQPRYGGAHGS